MTARTVGNPRRVRCPECGRLAERRRYTNGDTCYVHAKHVGLFGFIEVTDSCFVKCPKSVKP